MADLTFQAGSILVECGTNLPSAMSLDNSAFSQTWGVAPEVHGVGLETQLTNAGWTLFYMAGAIHKRGFGFNEEARVRAAVASVIADVHAGKCNCVEITSLVNKSFLGIPYVGITAHARHIQDGLQFRGR